MKEFDSAIVMFVLTFMVLLAVCFVIGGISLMWLKTNADYRAAQGEKQKNHHFNRAFDRLVYFLIGLLLAVPVALWAFGHLFWAGIWGIKLTDVVLPMLDLAMTFLAFAVFVGSIYYAGTRNAAKDIITDTKKVVDQAIEEFEKPA